MIEQVLADAAERANTLRLEGHPVQALAIERVLDQVRAAAAEYLTWLSEPEAMAYTGRSAQWLRAHFGQWYARGLARWDSTGRARQYRRCVLRHRGNPEATRADGQRAAKGAA
jgi:hypothetical protein